MNKLSKYPLKKSKLLSLEVKEKLNLNNITKAYFIERPNRFIVHCKNENNAFIRAHLPNPGRLDELFFPNSIIYLSKASDQKKKSKVPRRTSYTVIGVERDGYPVFLHTHDTNSLIEILLNEKLIEQLAGYTIEKREATYGKSRFDFLLKKDTPQPVEANHNSRKDDKIAKENQLWLEVKSCTLFGNNVAMFPDAITARGRKHLLELAKLRDSGVDCAVVFAVHCPDVKYFMPDFHTDLQFSQTLMNVKDQVKIIPVAIPWQKDMSLSLPVKEVTVPWKYLSKTIKDTGTYLALAYFEKPVTCKMKSNGFGENKNTYTFERGYYIYTSSFVEGNLEQTIRRLKNKKRKIITSIPKLLVSNAVEIRIMAIRSPNDQSQIIKNTFQNLGAKYDISTNKSLIFTKENPIDNVEFHNILEKFRMKQPD